jgi:hypothetical protein
MRSDLEIHVSTRIWFPRDIYGEGADVPIPLRKSMSFPYRKGSPQCARTVRSDIKPETGLATLWISGGELGNEREAIAWAPAAAPRVSVFELAQMKSTVSIRAAHLFANNSHVHRFPTLIDVGPADAPVRR